MKHSEIDYTAGDIDATLSMSSWSYIPRDSDPEFDGIVRQVNRASSLPALAFRTGRKCDKKKAVLSPLENGFSHCYIPLCATKSVLNH